MKNVHYQEKKKKINMNISDSVKYHIVIFIENNEPKNFDIEMVPLVKTSVLIPKYLLTSGKYPNMSNVDLEGINIYYNSFRKLINNL